MRKLLAIAKREFRAATGNKTFVIMTILGPFILLALTVLPSMLSTNTAVMSSGKPMAISVDDQLVSRFLTSALDGQGVETVAVTDLAATKEKVLAGDYAGYVEIPAAWPDEETRYFTKSGTEAILFSTIENVLASYATQERIKEAGLTPEQATRLLSRPSFRVIKLGANQSEETKTQDDFMGILFTALSFVMLIYMTVLLYGQMIGRSVVQEKTNKTVEIMLSSVSTRDLMFGKILGLGLAGLFQYAVWIIMGVLMIKVVGPAFNLSLPTAVTIDSFLWLVLFFILAFFLYAAGYAALGAAAEDEHHLGQLAWPLIIFLIVPMVLISPMVMSPGSPLVVGLSLFPLTSPIVMLVRVLVSTPAWWEIALCLVLLVASIYGLAVFGAKIFRTGILMSGKRPKLGEIIRWARVR